MDIANVVHILPSATVRHTLGSYLSSPYTTLLSMFFTELQKERVNMTHISISPYL